MSRSTNPSCITLIALSSFSRIAAASSEGAGKLVSSAFASAAAFSTLASAAAQIALASPLILAIASS